MDKKEKIKIQKNIDAYSQDCWVAPILGIIVGIFWWPAFIIGFILMFVFIELKNKEKRKLIE